MSTTALKTVRLRDWRESLATSLGEGDELLKVLKGKVPVRRDEAAKLLGDLTRLDYVSSTQLTCNIEIEKIAEILAQATAKLPEKTNHTLRAEAETNAAIALHAYLNTVGFGRHLAGDEGVWTWLNLNVPDWSLARWKGSAGRDAGHEQWFGNATSNALGRLFWAAELMRNGEDYTPVRGAFLNQNVINEIDREIYRSRHWAVALALLAADFDGAGNQASDDEWNIVSKVANHLAFLNRPEASPLDEEMAPFGDTDPEVVYEADPRAIADVQTLLGRFLINIAGAERIRTNKLYCPDGSR
jgi:hypothetical protein